MPKFWEQDEVIAPAGQTAPVAPATAPVATPGSTGGLRMVVAPQPDQPAAQTPVQAAQDVQQVTNARLEAQLKELQIERERRALTERSAGKPLPEGAWKPYKAQVDIYSQMAGAADAFQDDFAGNTLTGGLENTAQGLYSGVGTPGQRDWWANFRRADNIIRNQLFGATLTPGEQRSYEQTSINERMDPAEVRRNLQSRREIIRNALSRQTNFLRAQGYNQESIDALAGQHAPDFRPAESGVGGEQAGGAPDALDRSAAVPMIVGNGAPKLEASPTGGGNFPTERDTAFIRQAQEMFNAGAQRADLDALAVSYGYGRYGPELEKGLEARSRGIPVRLLTPTSGFKEPSLIGAAAATPGGSYFASAGNALSGGTIDEIAGAMGGSQEQAQTAKEVMREAHPVASLAGEVTGAGLAMTGVGRLPGMAGRSLVADASYGAVYGAGESNENRVGGAVVGGAAGAAGNVAVRAIGGVASRYRSRPPSPARAAGREVLEAGQRQGIDVMPADVGGPAVRRLTSAAAQGPVSAIPIVRRAQQVTAQAQAARDRIANDIAAVVEPEAAGQAARRGAQAFIGRTATRARTLYNQAESLARGVEVPLTNARANIDQHIAELESVPGGSEGLEALRTLRDEMDGAFTVQGIRGMRTQLRDRFISNGLRGSDLERRVNQVVDAAGDDIVSGLQAAGRNDAASAYRAADRYWRARVRTIDEALEPIIGQNGQKSGEEIISALERDSRGNNARLASFVRALPEDEQAIVRSTFVGQLGRGNAGTQNAAGDAFSLPQFLTHWNRMSPGAKRTLFTGESRAALDDLARVAEGTREAQRYQNFSNTAGGVTGQLLISGVPYAMGGLLYTVAALGSQYGVGNLLARPGFARWLARAPRTGMPRAYIDRLERIARADAAIAPEVTGLRQALLSAANDNVTPAVAASETDQDRHQ